MRKCYKPVRRKAGATARRATTPLQPIPQILSVENEPIVILSAQINDEVKALVPD